MVGGEAFLAILAILAMEMLTGAASRALSRVTEKTRRHRTENSVLHDPGGGRAGGVRGGWARSKHASSYPRNTSGEP